MLRIDIDNINLDNLLVFCLEIGIMWGIMSIISIPLFITLLGFLPPQTDNRSIVLVDVQNEKELKMLRDIGANSLACFDHHGPTPIILDFTQQTLATKLGISFEIIEPSVQRYLERFESLRVESRNGGIGGWFSDFKTWDQVNDKLTELETLNPNIVTGFVAGETHEGRDIRGIRITAPGDSNNRKQVLWNGCQHAREWVAVMVPMYLAVELVDGWYNNEEIHDYLESTEVIIVPIVNPDGYEFTYAPNGDRFWRKNRRNNSGSCEGVDLNRNWSYQWNGGDSTSNDTCSDIYVGPSVFSEPETQAMRDLVNALPNLVAHIDFHCYSQLVLEPWASSNNPPPREAVVKSLSNQMSDAIYSVHGETYVAGTGGDLLYLADGVFPDFVTNLGALSYTIELRPTGSPGFDLPPAEILPTCEESFEGAMAMLRFINEPILFSFPNGTPQLPEAGDLLTFPINIEPVFEDLIIEETATLHIRFGNGQETTRPIQYKSGSLYEIELPVSYCGLATNYWCSIETTDGQLHRYPQEDTLSVGVAEALHVWNMDENPGWLTTGLWAWGVPSGGGGQYGNPDPISGATGQNVVGYNLNGDYENNLPETHLITPDIQVKSSFNPQLQFSRYLNVEQPQYDHATLSVSPNGAQWIPLWTNNTVIEDDEWQTVTYDLSVLPEETEEISIRWTMGSTDSAWQYSGWNIDDVKILSTTNVGVLGDTNCDGLINVNDVLAIVSEWGPCGHCPEDVVPDGTINISDLLEVIGNW